MKSQIKEKWSLAALMLLLTALLAIDGLAASADSAKWLARGTGPNSNQEAQITLKDDQSVEVRFNRPPKDLPPSVEVTFFDKELNPTTIELKTLSLRDRAHPVFSGVPTGHSMSPQQQSVMGIELTLRLPKRKPGKLRWGTTHADQAHHRKN